MNGAIVGKSYLVSDQLSSDERLIKAAMTPLSPRLEMIMFCISARMPG
jgi:hypothetical protein